MGNVTEAPLGAMHKTAAKAYRRIVEPMERANCTSYDMDYEMSHGEGMEFWTPPFNDEDFLDKMAYVAERFGLDMPEFAVAVAQYEFSEQYRRFN